MKMSFSELNLSPEISKAIQICGYTIPTPIQAKAIPVILEGRDIVASAPTGTGKTAAFILPALHRLSFGQTGMKPRILVLTPTRELATQITDTARKYGKFLRFNMVSLVGGMPYRQQLKGLSHPIDVIIATPGRLMDHMENGRLDLSGIEMLILDEADRMLDMGFIDDVKYIAKATPKTKQTLLFSATVDDRLGGIVKQLLNSPVRIDLSEKTAAPTKIKQELYIADHQQHKLKLLQHFLTENSIFKGIIFSAMKINADKLAMQLRDQDISALPLHGDLKQNVRNKTIEQFRRGKVQFLVATDVAARGLDINDVTHVINFDLPKFSEDYVHRIGRTGRAGKSGIAISFALPNEGRHVQKIEKYIGERIELLTIEGLEPRQGLSNAAPAKSKGGRRSGGGKPGGYKKSGDFKFSDRSAGDRGRGRSDERSSDKSFRSDRAPQGEKSFRSERAPFGEKSGRGDRSSQGEKSFRSERPPYADKSSRSDRAPQGEKSFRSERPSFGDKGARSDRGSQGEKSFRSERAPFGEKSGRGDRSSQGEKSFRSERPPYADKSARSDRAPQGEKSFRSERPSYGDKAARGERSSQGEKSFRSERPSFGDKSARSDRAPAAGKSFRSDRAPQGEKKFRSDKAPFGDKGFKGASRSKTGGSDKAPAAARNFRTDKPVKSERSDKNKHY
jgi:superfamily II DNA/RNA helicase